MKPEPQNTTLQTPTEDARASLSALADGDAQAADQACKRWRDDAEARRTWHAYHLIGDVMRSDDLARPAGRDAAFLAGLRDRLALEPVLLAPQAIAAAPPRRRQPWLLPLAAAAGFVVVAGVLVVSRLSQPGAEPAPSFAGVGDAVAPGGVVLVGNGTARPVAAGTAGGVVLRDARLDEFVRAHQFARGGVAVAAPGGALRSVEMPAPATPAR